MEQNPGTEAVTKTTRALEPRFFRLIGRGLLYFIGGVVGLALIAVAVLFPTILVSAIAVAIWVLLWKQVYRHDAPPYTYSRFACALLVAWAVDALGFRFLTQDFPRSFRHFVPALIVVSVFAGFAAWNALPAGEARRELWMKDEPQPRVELSHPFAGFVSFMIMLFAMAYLVMPVLTHLPYYGSYLSERMSSGWSDDSP